MDIEYGLIIDATSQAVKAAVLTHLDELARCTKADIFLLQPKTVDVEVASFNGSVETSLDQRLRCLIYGDMETAEHAKTRVLIMIDQIVRARPAHTSARRRNLTITDTSRSYIDTSTPSSWNSLCIRWSAAVHGETSNTSSLSPTQQSTFRPPSPKSMATLRPARCDEERTRSSSRASRPTTFSRRRSDCTTWSSAQRPL